MKIIDPRDLNIVIGVPPSVDGGIVSIDTEFFGMNENKLHRPHGVFASMGASYDGHTVYIITDEKDIPEFVRAIQKSVHIYHNAHFDIGQIRRYCEYPDRKKMVDIMILEQIMYAGYFNKGQFSLADLARRYLDVYMDKSVRKQFAESDSMSKEQIEYLAVDVVATWRVYQKQRELADGDDMSVWKDIDRGALYSILKTKGMPLDRYAWEALYIKNLRDAEQIAKKYEGINLGSWQQVQKELNRLGYNLSSTNEKALQTIVSECEFARDILEYRGKTKAAGTYGMRWLDEHLEADGRVYSNFFINGTATGRFSSSNPNVENIPQKDGPEFRRSFVAKEDYVFVDADFSAQEPRIWTYLSQDDLMLDIFQNKKDIYIESARLMFGWNLDKKDPRRKTRMKPTVLGAIFGLTEYGLLEKDQIPLEEGKELLDAFWRAYPRSKEYADNIRSTKDYVTTVYGRKYWLNPYQKGYKNNCLNSPVQGTAADIIKIAGYRFQLEIEKCGYIDRVWIINYVHDEILVECHKDLLQWTTDTLSKIMMSTAEETHNGVPADIEIKSGTNWADAH